MVTIKTAFGPLLASALSIVVLTETGDGIFVADLAPPRLTAPRASAMRAPVPPVQFPVPGSMHGIPGSYMYGGYSATPPSYTPRDFNRGSHPDNASFLAYSLGRSHAFSRRLYNPEPNTNNRTVINILPY